MALGIDMNLTEYLGLGLKSDAVIELLEHFDMQVVYAFDRLHENAPDRYFAAAKAMGFQLRFNEQQVLDAIWCYIRSRGDFAAVDVSSVGVHCYASFEEAKTAAESIGVKISTPPSGTKWIRLERDQAWHHYEFAGDELVLVTLMLPWS